jgi:hypothetical protein
MAKMMTFLQLSQEFGGTRFGPFDQVEIRLGSDPENSEITLPPSLGVAPQHVKVLKQQDETYILAPVDRTASLFYFRSTGGKAKQVTAPLACKAGDSFALVTAEGPRFFLQSEKNPKAIAAAAAESEGPGWGGINKPNLKAGGIIKEIKRRGLAKVFATRLGNMAMNGWRMVKTGQIFSPLYIVGGMLFLSGYLFSAGSCAGLYRANNAKKSAQASLSRCQDQCGINGEESGEGDPTFADLTKNILVDTRWKPVIQTDTALREAYANELKAIYADPARYQWVFKRENSPYTQFAAALDQRGLPENLVRTLAFAATRGRMDQDWFRVFDSEGAAVCGRGPLGLTYRTAYNLGLTNLQPDALVEAQVAESNDLDKQKALLDATLQKAGAQIEYREDQIQTAGADLQGGLQCLYIDGTDDRDDIREVARALAAKLGTNGNRMAPGQGEGYWIAARLVALFAHDFRFDLENVSFDAKTPPSVALKIADIPQGNIDFAIKEAAAVMARATAIPCQARFDRDQKEPPPWLVKTPPQLGQCAILRAYVEFDRLE